MTNDYIMQTCSSAVPKFKVVCSIAVYTQADLKLWHSWIGAH